jgi:uncharacterized membrane protein
MAHGLIPYRDYFMEFPPGALPALVLPALPGSHYVVWFKAFEFLCGIGTLACLAAIVARLGATRTQLSIAIAITAVAPAVLGAISINSFDYWPALLVTASVAALVAGRRRTGFALLGVATAAKLFPFGLLALALLFVVRRYGRERWRESVIAYVTAVVIVFGPFAVLGPGGLKYSLQTQLERGLQLESLGASILATAHQLGAYRPSFTPHLAYAQLAGPLASGVATLSTVVMFAAIALAAWLYHRSRGGEDQLVLAAATTVVGIVTFAKALSPQYLIWLIPLVAATSLWTRLAPLLLFAALGLTQVWVPDRFAELQAMQWVTWVLLARNLVLLALFALLIAELRARAVSDAGSAQPAAGGRAGHGRRRSRLADRGRTA